MPPSFFSAPDIIAIYDAEQEIVYFDEVLFEAVDETVRRKVWRLREPVLRLTTTEFHAL